MTDYQPLLKRAMSGLDNSTLEGRRSVYERARHALVNQLRTVTPPLAEADITRERLALEEAIRRVEAEAAAAATPAPAAPAPAVAPVAPQAFVQPQAPLTPPTPPQAQPQAPVAPVQAWPAPAQARIQPVPQPQAPVLPQLQVQVQPQAPVPPQPQSPSAPRGAVTAPATASPRVAARSAPIPRARVEPAPGIRPAPPQARAPMPAGMDSARRPVVSDPRAPVSGVDLDSVPAEPTDFRPPPPPPLSSSPAAARPPRPRSAVVARADRRKALRAKLVVGGIVVILLAVAAGLGYVHRERILAFLHMGPALVAEADRPKVVDRVASDPNAVARPAQPQPAGSITAALFLADFVDPATHWMHFDIMAWNPSARPGRPEGGEAQAIRGLFSLIAERAGRPKAKKRS